MNVPLKNKLSWSPKINKESSNFGWFKLESLPKNIFPSIKSIVDSLSSLQRQASYLNYLK